MQQPTIRATLYYKQTMFIRHADYRQHTSRFCKHHHINIKGTLIWKYNQIQTLLDLELLCESTPQTIGTGIISCFCPVFGSSQMQMPSSPARSRNRELPSGNPFPPSFCISLLGHFYPCSFCKIIFLANSSPKSFGTFVGTRCSDE